jgi:hypothetical protein
VGSGTAWVQRSYGPWDITGTMASRARGGRRRCGPGDFTGRWRRGLGNGVGCIASWAQGGQCCCGLWNDATGLGTAPTWSTATPARVEEDGGV